MANRSIALALAALLLPIASAGMAQVGPTTTRTPIQPKATNAPDAPVNGITYLYSATQKCPTDANGNEITVCVRRSPDEQFRIPKELRPDTLKPAYQSWALRGSETVADIGRTGIGSCSNEGVGGTAGCASDAFARAREEKRARRAAEAATVPR